MAELLTRTFSFDIEQLIDAFEDKLPAMGLQKMGSRRNYGLVSFKTAEDDIFYAHFAEIEDGSTKLTIAPNLSYIKDRRQSELPEETIKSFFDNFEIALNTSKT